MSGAAPLPRPAGGSLAYRILSARVSDLLRGRIEPPAGADRVIADAQLPAPLAELVQRVVRRTRLWRTERAEVARELVSHFEDGLAAGVGAEELAASFGNPVRAAKLIRRAKRRNRPLAWRALNLTERAVGTLALLALVVYVVQAARLYGGRLNVARNYMAEWNVPALAVPEAERAWPVYRAAALEMGPWPRQWDDWDMQPRSPSWADVAAFAEENAAVVALFRRAAGMPKMAWILAGALTEEDAALYAGRSPTTSTVATAAPPVDENPPFMSVLLSPVSVLRTGARLLSVDAHLAAAEGEAQHACDDVLGILQMVDHTRESRFLIADLVGIAIAQQACRVLGALLHDEPGLFSDEQLTSLAHRVAAVGEGSLCVRLDGERASFADILQRYYTDDGRGDGLARRDLFEIYSTTGDPAPAWWRVLAAPSLMPAASTVMAGRRETRTRYEYFMDRYERELRTPMWERRGPGVDAEIEALAASPWERLHYWPVFTMLPALDRAVAVGDLGEQVRDGTLVAIALELYRRRHGAWPASLDDLTPQWLPKVPIDRYDGKPLRYKLVDGQPLVYSVGVDRDDDGGRLPEPKGLGPDAPRRRLRANRDAARWQPPPDPNQPAPPDWPDGDWILWPPVSG